MTELRSANVEPEIERELDLNDALLRAAIDAAPDGIVIVDDSGVIVFANPMTSRMFGYEPDELEGGTVDVLVPSAFRDAHRTHRRGYTEHPRARAMGSGLDLRGQRRSGEEFPVEISLSPVGSGGRTFVIAIIRDVSERRHASEELMHAHEQLALVDDRERIARDLHDTVIQRLFAVGLSLQGVMVGVSDMKITARIESAIDEIDGTIRDIRTAIFALHARRMPTAGLREDILATVREAGRALGFEPQVTFDGAVDTTTPEHVREQLLPTLREALSNVVKHAAASRVGVTVAAEGPEIVLVVTDDGRGVRDEAHGGRGLGNMNERALALGGSCEVRSGEHGGTVVEWRVPARGDANN